jgi:ketosteroid isomerase-like protein
MASEAAVTTDSAEAVQAIERQRLRAFVEADVEVAARLHTPDFQVVDPRGGTHSKEEILGWLAAGVLDYRRFEAVSDVQVTASGDLAVLYYRSGIDVLVQGLAPQSLEAWLTICYRRAQGDAGWQVFWHQETAITAE